LNYFDFYHFLEGLTKYDKWGEMIDETTKHKKIKNNNNRWHKKDKIHQDFKELFNKFKNSKLVISYRDDGIPTTTELVGMLEGLGKKVKIHTMNYQYVLSQTKSSEILIVAN